MKKNNIFQFIKTRLKKLRIINKENNKVIKKINIFEDERIDSLQLVNILAEIEKKYSVKINYNYFNLKKNQTIDKICEIISKKIK